MYNPKVISPYMVGLIMNACMDCAYVSLVLGYTFFCFFVDNVVYFIGSCFSFYTSRLLGFNKDFGIFT